mgnify:CR=1 FL=1
MPKISIIVPIYNVEKYLPRCIDSILAQTFTDFELILVDDGSPDNCGKICDEYAKKDNRIKVIHKENGGVSSARNIGLDVAKGEYISFVDSDDVIHPKFYEIMLGNIRDADMIYCDFIMFDNECKFDDISDLNYEVRENKDIYNGSPFSVVCDKLIKNNVVGELRFRTDLKNAEDTLFAFELLASCNKVIYLKVKLYGYYMRANSAASSADIEGKINIVDVCQFMYDTDVANNNKKLKKHLQVSLFYSHLDLYYKSKGVNEQVQNNSMNFIKHNIFSLLFLNGELTVKEKVALVLNLMGLR